MLVYELLLLYQLVLLKHAITNHYISYMKLHAWLLLIITHLAINMTLLLVHETET